MNFKKLNNIIGWLVFAIATFVYVKTIEPTTSWWDCGEFITAAFKLEVGHPPGAPFFMLLGRIFSLFSFRDVTKVAAMINTLSALASSFSILFLFWSITLLARKIFIKEDGKIEGANIIAILGSGVIGALAYTFTDSFWFSAVEGEVYALSSFFTAIVFWAILKYDEVAQKNSHSLRWIVLIAYLMGLSIGVHLLNLLVIPAIAYVYYYKNYKYSTKGFIYAGIISVLVLVVVQYGIIQQLVAVASKFELLFVNSMGMPFNTGIIIYSILIISGLTFGLYYTQKHKKVLYNTALLCITFILLGYSTYAVIVVRSSANPPMDENDPENVFSLLSYLNREQYGDRPLFYGPQFTAGNPIDQKEGDFVYIKGKEKYEKAGTKITNIYNEDHETVFPRMYSNQSHHIEAYMKWSGMKSDKKKPTFGENLKFLFSYQMGFMYFRYFFWNFVGRQSDIQTHGNITDGNWISGINAIDSKRLGDQDNLPPTMENNIGKNKYYFLPLILGILGIIYQYNKSKKETFVVFLLFFMTGLAIVLYLNQYPYQPRERDYAFAGSFYAFAIWIGFGVLSIFEFISKKAPKKLSAVIAFVLCLGVPTIMAVENWDDHDRSGKTSARDFAHNYLESCAPNAILFTNGDNDTFPLWYAQEVEGIRTDVRVVNLALLAGEWYIYQMKLKAYESEPLPISLSDEFYKPGNNSYLPFVDRGVIGYADLNQIIDFVGSDAVETKIPTRDGELLGHIPTKKLKLKVDTTTFPREILPERYKNKIQEFITWDVFEGKTYVGKHELILYDILATNNWKRPIYFVAPTSVDNFLNISKYCQQEGFAYRLVPIVSDEVDGMGCVNTKIMYDNIANKFDWGGLNDPDVNIDTETMRMTRAYKMMFIRLSNELIRENNKDKALKTLDLCFNVMPKERVPLDELTIYLTQNYYKIGEFEKGNALLNSYVDIVNKEITYYLSLNAKQKVNYETEIQQRYQILAALLDMCEQNKKRENVKNNPTLFKKIDGYSKELNGILNSVYTMVQ